MSGTGLGHAAGSLCPLLGCGALPSPQQPQPTTLAASTTLPTMEQRSECKTGARTWTSTKYQSTWMFQKYPRPKSEVKRPLSNIPAER